MPWKVPEFKPVATPWAQFDGGFASGTGVPPFPIMGGSHSLNEPGKLIGFRYWILVPDPIRIDLVDGSHGSILPDIGTGQDDFPG